MTTRQPSAGGHALRTCAVVVLVGALAAGMTAVAVAQVAATWPRLAGRDALPLDDLLALGASCALLLCVGWGLLGAAVGLVEAVTGATPRLLNGFPASLARRAVLVGCGVAAGSALVSPAALADPTGGGLAVPAGAHAVAPPAGAPDLRGLQVPDRRTDPLANPLERTVRVRPGESLWSISADRQPAGAPPEQVVEGWHALYRANRAAIGPDPDLVRAGALLRVPDRAPFTHRPDRPGPATTGSEPQHREDAP